MSVRKNIINAFITKLRTIKTDDGYNNDIKHVSKDFIDPSRVSEFPTTCLLIGDTNYIPLTSSRYTSGDARNAIDGWPISVISYVRAESDDEALNDAIENINEDVIKCILADHTLGNVAGIKNVYLAAVLGHIPAGDEMPFGASQIIFLVKYDFEKDSP